MILKYKTELKILGLKACEHIENGIIRRDNLMQTDFIPLNFEAPIKNYVLREGHELWDSRLQDAANKIVKEWLSKLGLNPDGYEINYDEKEITPKDNPHWNPDYHKTAGTVDKDREVGSI